MQALERQLLPYPVDPRVTPAPIREEPIVDRYFAAEIGKATEAVGGGGGGGYTIPTPITNPGTGTGTGGIATGGGAFGGGSGILWSIPDAIAALLAWLTGSGGSTTNVTNVDAGAETNGGGGNVNINSGSGTQNTTNTGDVNDGSGGDDSDPWGLSSLMGMLPMLIILPMIMKMFGGEGGGLFGGGQSSSTSAPAGSTTINIVDTDDNTSDNWV